MLKRVVYLHTSYKIALVSVFFLIGVWLSNKLRIEFGNWLTMASGCILLIDGFILKNKFIAVAGLITGSVLVGLWRGDIQLVQNNNFRKYYGSSVEIIAKVTEDSATVASGKQQIKLKVMNVDGRALSGNILATLSQKQIFTQGENIDCIAILSTGTVMYQAKANIVNIKTISHDNNPALDFKYWFENNLRQVIDEPAASLGLGFLVGEKTALPQLLVETIKIVGLTHVLVASGYNLTIIVRFCRRLFSKISKYLGLVSSLILIWSFVSITGFSSSMTRASIVAVLSLLAWYYGRKFNVFVLLALTAALTVIWSPSYAWQDLGWQLSFAAFAGVLVVSPIISSFLYGEEKIPSIVQIIFETTSAGLMTIPIIAMNFGYISVISLIANALLLPLVPLVMIMTFVAGIILPISTFWSHFVGFYAEKIINLFINGSQYFAAVSWAKIDVIFDTKVFVTYYALLGLVLYALHRKSKLRFSHVNIVS